MKDVLRNPVFYYIVVPAAVAVWPVLIWLVYLPKAEENWIAEKNQYIKAQKVITQILELDPERLDFTGSETASTEFDYSVVVDRIAGLCGISSTNYELSSKPVRSSKGQKSQDCAVILKKVGVAKFAKFLSAIQLRWANLQCSNVTIRREKGLPDTWKVTLDFRYYY